MLIDVRTHTFPAKLAERTLVNLCEKADNTIAPVSDGTLDGLLADMRASGLDSADMLEYFRCCRDLNLIVQCHCGFDVGFPFEPLCGPERVARVIREVPGLRFIAAHLGGWRQWGGATEHLLGKDLFLDTSILPQDNENRSAMTILREHPSEKLLFATDWPWLSFADGIEYVRKAGLKKADTHAILGGNAAKLLGVTKPAAW